MQYYRSGVYMQTHYLLSYIFYWQNFRIYDTCYLTEWRIDGDDQILSSLSNGIAYCSLSKALKIHETVKKLLLLMESYTNNICNNLCDYD